MRVLPRSLHGRLLVLVLGLVAAVWLGALALTWRDARHELDELLDGHLAQAAALLVAQQAREVDDGDAADAPVLHRYAPKVAFQVFHEGRLALRSANAPALPMAQAGHRFRAGFRTIEIDGTAWRVFAAHGAEQDVQVYVSEQVDSRGSILRAVLRSVAWPMLFALPLLALASWWAIHQGLGPLRELGRALAARRPEALQQVVLPDAPSEMEPLLLALNALFGRIARLMDAERRFTADAAHELRTPIAAIRAQAQVALGEADAAARRHALEATLQGCDRAARLVEQLLTLSRLESGAAPQLARIDLGDVARHVAAEAAPRAMAMGQAIEVSAAGPCPVMANATLAGVLVRNLVDNAMQYSSAPAKVKLSVSPGDGVARLAVEDSGPGLAPADAARLGERFFRVMGTGVGGSGLGWSIVRRIAAVHGARVDLGRSSELGGLRVGIEWPAAP
jgi:two-component system, OmpR family, sensor histidine kinase QseC